MLVDLLLNENGVKQAPATLGYPGKSIPEAIYPEQQLKALNELYRFVTEVTNDCLWDWNLRTREIFWIDGGHKRVFGYPVENGLISQDFWEDRLHPEDKIRILTKLNKIITEGAGSSWEDEYRFEKANGDYAYVHDRGHIIYDGNKMAVRMIGATQDITARKLMESKSAQEMLARQKEVTDAVLTAHESERAAIGKELHDNLNQILGAAKLLIEVAKTDAENRQVCLEKAARCISDVIEDIRHISKSLSAPGMVMGLSDSIRLLLDDLLLTHPVKIEFYEEGIDESVLDEKMQLDIFRIVQEQVNNILKHASASRATIYLTGHHNKIILLIGDNGQGCDMAKKKRGVGIINIKSRAELYHGKCSIITKPGDGFALKVVLPLELRI